MMDLTGMQIFAMVVDVKSFSAAGLRLEMSTPMVSRHVTQLEKSLGTRLLNRTTRQLSLTETGVAFYEYCRRIVREAEEAQQMVAEMQSTPRGKLRISSSAGFGALHIAPGLSGFLAQYPEIDVDLRIHDHPVQLEEEGYELVIRTGQEPGLNEVVKPIAPLRRIVCAAPSYLEKYGVPKTPDDLKQHNCLIYYNATREDTWYFMENGEKHSVVVKGNLCINNGNMLRQMARDGLGLLYKPTYSIYRDLLEGTLQAVLTQFTPAMGNIYAAYLPNHRISPRVKAFVDFFTARFGCPTYWDQAVAALPL